MGSVEAGNQSAAITPFLLLECTGAEGCSNLRGFRIDSAAYDKNLESRPQFVQNAFELRKQQCQIAAFVVSRDDD